MSNGVDEEIKRWMARRKSSPVLDVIQGKTTVAEASWQFDLPPSAIESWGITTPAWPIACLAVCGSWFCRPGPPADAPRMA
ncbi:hypothetical protein [Rhodanobacter thiooxydans]|uniref:hypothetical protein n=1 Tax=Rhodanobacter thiooxydans TaxID=416169 RepID=UPI000260E297|nr:hypothetical protein [Rhodanobacter thiooxydans]EIM00589.1 transposase [Rhodanobacter thiooxydans LCS2]